LAEPEQERSALFGIGNLMSRMTGAMEREEAQPQRTPPRVSPVHDEMDDEERARMEIPAFLRRQAN
jgi:cell division protein FtsZ